MTTRVFRRMAIAWILALALVQCGCVTGHALHTARGGEAGKAVPREVSPADDTVEEAGTEDDNAQDKTPATPQPAMYALVPFAIVADILLIPFWIVVTILVNLGLMEEPF